MVCCPPRTTWLCLPLPTFLHSASSHSPHHEEQSSIAALQLSLSLRTHLHSCLTLSVHRNFPPRPPTPLSVSFNVLSGCLCLSVCLTICLSSCVRLSVSVPHPLSTHFQGFRANLVVPLFLFYFTFCQMPSIICYPPLLLRKILVFFQKQSLPLSM